MSHASLALLRVLAPSLLLVAACDDGAAVTDPPPTETTPTFVASSLERDTSPDVPAADLAAVVAGNNAFALDLYGALAAEDGNLIASPHSASVALAMTYAGAAGNTATEMASTLHFDLPAAQLHPAFDALDLALASRGEGAQGADGEPFRLKVVNAAWGQTGYTFLPGFLDTLAVSYGAGVRLLDFFTAPDPSRLTINAWVSEQTEKRIPNLLPAGTITSDTKLVLTNAVYFNAAWALPFDPDHTADAAFVCADGETVTVPTMTQTESFRYAAGDGWSAIELAYDGGEVAMDIILPDDLASFESGLDATEVDGILGQLVSSYVELHMPRFEYRLPTNLVPTLQSLGMSDAFVPLAADFSGMNGRQDLYIGAVIHEAFVKVDEKGTEAAAATAVVMNDFGLPGEPVVMRLDRPFVYFIRDVQTGAILFVGRVSDPSAS
ncbi:MAG: serpin family protein [Deltaproteobacteria bacterium]|nr:MAG: serpin family protein [Deltaproteobacteria bacterium]